MKRGLLLSALAACSFDPRAGAIDAPRQIDTPELDATIDAAPLGAFGAPQPLTVLNSAGLEDDPSLTADMLQLFFASNRGNAYYDEDIYVASRASVTEDFGAPMLVSELSLPNALDSNVEVSADGLTITFTSSRGGNDDLWIAKRDTANGTWGTPVIMAELNSLQGEYGGVMTTVGTEQQILLCSGRGGNEALYLAVKQPADAMYSAPVLVDGLDTSDHECDGARPDADTLYFTRAAAATPLQLDLYRARREGTRYFDVEPVPELNTESRDSDPWVSPDQRTIFFSRDTANDGADDLYMATR